MKKTSRTQILLILVIGILFSFSTVSQSFEHGLGTETLPPVSLGDKLVSLEAITTIYDQPEINGRQIQLVLLELDSRITIRDVTFLLKVMKGNEFLFEHTFQKDDGILILDMIPSESNQITIKESPAGLFESLLGIESKSLATGDVFKKGGLYLIELQILTAESYSNELEKPIKYNFGLSFPEITIYEIDDPNFGNQFLKSIAYYDSISNFRYDPNTKVISFEIPFDWLDESLEQSKVVHNEIIIPKSFGGLLVPSYILYVNNIQLPEYIITVDDFSEFTRTVHIIIPQDELYKMNENMIQKNGMKFSLIPQTDDWHISTITANGQFKINLRWEESDVKPDSTTIFHFNILDVFLKDRPIAIPYDVSLVHDGNIIDTKNGVSTDIKGKHNSMEFFIPEDVLNSTITLQFENLDGNSFARIGLPIIVNKVDSSSQVSIPDWVRNNAGWWAAEQIEDLDFVSGIEFMIKEGIIQVPVAEKQEGSESVIPDWVRNNAGRWSQGLISDDDFAKGLQFLVSNGIISV